VADIIRELNHMLGIKTKLSIAFHPQTNSQTEKMNQELEHVHRLLTRVMARVARYG